MDEIFFYDKNGKLKIQLRYIVFKQNYVETPEFVVFHENGIVHRKNKPAIEYENGGWRWYNQGKLHRNMEPAVKFTNGSMHWYSNGLRHRIDGPAVIDPSLLESWWLNGKRHRIYGPATIWKNGYKQWFINGKEYQFQEYINLIFPDECKEKTWFQLKYI